VADMTCCRSWVKMWFALLVDDVLCDAVAVSGWHDVLQTD